MYQSIVRQNVRRGFHHLSQGDYAPVLKQFAAAGTLYFAGDSLLGGKCVGREDIAQWFQQLYQIFPGIQFQIHTVVVSGWPWDTMVATRFSLAAPDSDEHRYTNEGMQFLRIRWGRIVEDAIYEDTQKLAVELARRAAQHADTPQSAQVLGRVL